MHLYTQYVSLLMLPTIISYHTGRMLTLLVCIISCRQSHPGERQFEDLVGRRRIKFQSDENSRCEGEKMRQHVYVGVCISSI